MDRKISTCCRRKYRYIWKSFQLQLINISFWFNISKEDVGRKKFTNGSLAQRCGIKASKKDDFLNKTHCDIFPFSRFCSKLVVEKVSEPAHIMPTFGVTISSTILQDFVSLLLYSEFPIVSLSCSSDLLFLCVNRLCLASYLGCYCNSFTPWRNLTTRVIWYHFKGEIAIQA